MRGKTSGLDKRPWSAVDPPHGPVEAEFIRPVLLGESIAPFRLLSTPLCIVPARGQELLDSKAASQNGFRHLAAWLRDAETKWATHAQKRVDGRLRMTLLQRIDHTTCAG
jgi:hypothetical protein